MINLLAFLTLFLAIFTPCVVLILKWEQTKDLKAWNARQRVNVTLENEAAWRRNKQMQMD